MFNIEPINSLPENVALVHKGVQIAFWGIPQEFLLTSEVAKNPFFITMTFLQDDSKEAKLDTGTIADNRLDMKLLNPHNIEPTASKVRVPLLNTRDGAFSLSFIMYVLSPSECSHLLFYYEFYEETLNTGETTPTQEEQGEVRP